MRGTQAQTEETEQMLEEMMSDEEVPSRTSVSSAVESMEPLTEAQRELITELFDNLDVVHDHLVEMLIVKSKESLSG